MDNPKSRYERCMQTATNVVIFSLELPGRISHYANKGMEMTIGRAFDYFTLCDLPEQKKELYKKTHLLPKVQAVAVAGNEMKARNDLEELVAN